MKSFARVMICAMAWVAAVPAIAQTPPDTVPPAAAGPWSDITTVVVRAKAPGPAMWKLTRGASTVWVMGALHVSPDKVTWDATRFRHVLTGAHVLILPRILDDAPLSLNDVDLRMDRQLRDLVSPATYSRFEAILLRENIEALPGDLIYTPAWSGVWLMSRVYTAHGINSRIVPPGIEADARQSGVPVKYVDRPTDKLERQQYFYLNRTDGEVCLNDYLDGIDHDVATIDLMGKAWAEGDVATILANHRDPAWVACFLSQPHYAQIYETYAVDDMVKTVDDALAVPGKSVAVMPLSDLLRKGGILDHLRAEGVEITAPLE